MVALARFESMVVLWLCPTYLLLHIPVVVNVGALNIVQPKQLEDRVRYELEVDPLYEHL